MRTIRAIIFFLSTLTLIGSLAQAQVLIRITTPPPPLPVYVQPVIPGPDFIWVPGYWAWGEFGYFWVPGTWVRAPASGLLWTPGYWAWSEGVYVWRAGYWGPRVGFYGGVNYGFGYTGVGYHGGYWRDRVFVYNTAVTRIGTVGITNVYTKTVVNSTTVTNVSYNGGPSGLKAQPTAQEQAVSQDKHVPPTALQTQHHDAAGKNRTLLASVNKGKPGIAATAKAGEFSGHGTVAARAVEPAPHQAKLQAGLAGKKDRRADATKMAGAPVPKHPNRNPRTPSHRDKKNHP
jgi:WXXGXW repeat (2 copies)